MLADLKRLIQLVVEKKRREAKSTSQGSNHRKVFIQLDRPAKHRRISMHRAAPAVAALKVKFKIHTSLELNWRPFVERLSWRLQWMLLSQDVLPRFSFSLSRERLLQQQA